MYNPSEEIIQIVDRDNNPSGSCTRAEMRKHGLTHRASYILVFNSQGEIFVQKRTMTKDIFPGYWDIAAGGVVLANESYDLSAKRELAEELGVNGVKLNELFDHYYESDQNKVWGRVYRCQHDGPFTLQKEEVQYGLFMKPEEILSLAEEELFTPDSLEILKRILTPSLSEDDTIKTC